MTLSELEPIFDGGVALWKRKLEVSGTRDFINWKPADRHDPREMRMALDLLVNLLDLESVEELVLLVESSGLEGIRNEY